MVLGALLRSVQSLRRNFNGQLALTVVTLCISQFNYGFDIAAFNNVQAMGSFKRQFGVFDPATKTYVLETYWLSLFNSFQSLGQIVGIVAGSWISKRYGRRTCVFTMCALAIIWGLILITSKNKWQILVGRTLNFIFTGMDLAVIPVYQAEITPAGNRGFTIGTYQFLIAVSQVIASGVCRATGSIQSNAAWQIPLGLFFWPPTAVMALIFLSPESPRWLAMNGRREEAKQSLVRLRKGKFTDEEIDVEFADILFGIDAEASIERGHWTEMFNKKNQQRTFVVVAANFFLAATGANFANTYGALFISQMSNINPFNVSIASNVGVAVIGLVTILLLDRYGRRWFPIVCTGILSIALFTMGGLGTVDPPTFNVKVGIITTMQLTIAAYSAGWAPVVHITSVELTSPRLRDSVYRFANVIQILTQFVSTFSLPYLLWTANLQSKVGLIFGSIAVIAFIFNWTCIPETKGLTLETIDGLYSDKVKFRDFQRVGKERMASMADTTSDDILHKSPHVVHIDGVDLQERDAGIPAVEHSTMR